MSEQIPANPFSQSTKFSGKRLHLGVSGSISCYKMPDVMRAWAKLGINVTVTLSSGATHFVTPLLFRSLGALRVHDEMFGELDEPFAHLEPGQTADVMVIAPASADAMARVAQGRASDMLSAQALAFSGPIIFAPAMNPRMWANPATTANAQLLAARGATIIEPATGLAACGENGKGRLAPLAQIFLEALKAMTSQDMAGINVLVTLGPTREKWDGVRFISNPSSGAMGAALATCAWLRGATVTAICGPGIHIFLPCQINRVNVQNAIQMYEAARQVWPQTNMGMFCAAVADYAPVRPGDADNVKLKKNILGDSSQISLVRNPDILRELAAHKDPAQKVLGFAAEITPDMESLLPLALLKLQSKNADLVAANRVNPAESAFGARNNSMAIVDRNGVEEIWQTQPKADVAWELCSWLLRL